MNRKRLILAGLGVILVIILILAGIVAKRISDSRRHYDNSQNPASISEPQSDTDAEMLETKDAIDDNEALQQEVDGFSNTEDAVEDNSRETDSKEYILDENLLVAFFGSDERADEISRSDIIMLMNYESSKNEMTLISVPRDTKVLIEGYGEDKINHALAFGGSKLLQQTLESLFDVQIDYYCRVNFVGFQNIIDEFDGVEVDAKKDFRYNGEVIVSEGRQNLSGEDALFYVRYRSDADGDFGRIRRQQEVIGAVGSKVLGLVDYELYPKLLYVYESYLDTDLPFALLLEYMEYTDTSLTYNSYTLRTSSDSSTGIWYELYDETHLNELKVLLKSE